MFKDYYSILGITFPSNEDEIKQAYQSRVESLGTESSNYGNPNYQQRVDVEEAYRVLVVAYGLKSAYDEEYSKYIESENKDSYCIQESWTQSQIDSQHNTVVNRILTPMPASSEEKKKGWFKQTMGCFGGCLWKILGFILLIIAISAAKTCARKQMKNTLSESSINTEYVSSSLSSSAIPTKNKTNSNAERKLQNMAWDINQSLPRKMNDNMTALAITLTSSALVYEYEIDDDCFEMYKDQVLSQSAQLEQVKEMYSDMKPMINLLLETHRGISYKYVCKKSRETNIVEVPYSKLAGI